jgi:hypothetical protein
MYGLTVRWSLRDAPAGTAAALREYVRETSVPRFTGCRAWCRRPGR